MSDMREDTGRAVVRALSAGPQSRNQLFNKILPREAPDPPDDRAWWAAAHAMLDELVERGLVVIRQEPGPPIRVYELAENFGNRKEAT